MEKGKATETSGIFSQDSAFLQQYQAELLKKNAGKPNPTQISLLTGHAYSSVPGAMDKTKTAVTAQALQSAPSSMTTLIRKPIPQTKQLPQYSGQLPRAVTLTGKPAAIRYAIGGKPMSGRVIARPTVTVPVNPYYRKWKRLKKVIKDLMFVNAAVCDDVVRVEEKVAKAKEERRFLLRKVLYYQSLQEGGLTPSKLSPGGTSSKQTQLTSPNENAESQLKMKNRPKKKVLSAEKKKLLPTKEIIDPAQVKPKKSKPQNVKKVIPPLQLDSTGRPVFPLALGELTIHSIGEIVTDRSGFHTPKNIYPEGFCSTRVFASTIEADKSCLYTCKISDGGKGPVFEIAAEDNSELILRSNSPADCHNLLITAVNKSRGSNILQLAGRGPEFFGLSHPVVQNLIQSCPGSKRCTGYKWVKFEINRAETAATMVLEFNQDPTISFEAFKILLKGSSGVSVPETSTSLRSLLTSKHLAGTMQ